MIEQIIDSIAVHIKENVPSVSKSGGIAQVVTVSSDGKPRRYPACINPGKFEYAAMLPDALESVVSFFQVVNNDLRSPAPGGRVDMVSLLRLVLWTNATKIYPGDVDAVIMDVLAAIKTFKFDSTALISPKAVKVMFERFEPKSKSIFSAYTFDEGQTQFLMPPFDWRSIQIRVLYSITASCSPGRVASVNIC